MPKRQGSIRGRHRRPSGLSKVTQVAMPAALAGVTVPVALAMASGSVTESHVTTVSEVLTSDATRLGEGAASPKLASLSHGVATETEMYAVRGGDTLSGIAKNKCGRATRWLNLYAANQGVIGGDPNVLEVGEQLKLACNTRTRFTLDSFTRPTQTAVSAVRQGASDGGVTEHYSSPAVNYSAPSSSWQDIVASMLGRGTEANCLVGVIEIESGGNVHATNPSSGAYGIPQALPGSKMAVAGADWATNPVTQLRWMIYDYVDPVYGSACAALAHEHSSGWY
jgi:hypothetical protein